MNKIKFLWVFAVLVAVFAFVSITDSAMAQKIVREQGGNRMFVGSGGSLDVISGGEIDVESGAALKFAGTALSSRTASIVNNLDYTASARWFDDFFGDALRTEWTPLKGSDAEALDPTLNISTSTGLDGVVRLTGGDDAAATMAVNGSQLSSYRQFRAADGGLVLEARIRPASVANEAIFVGFTDISTLEMPANSASSADTITTNATDGVGFMFDTAMATDNWWLVGVANDVDATAQNVGTAPSSNVYYTLKIEVSAAGVASFYINGTQVGTAMTGAVTPSVALTPTVAVFSRTTSTKAVDVDFIQTLKTRAS